MNAADSSPSSDRNNRPQHSVGSMPPASSHNGETTAVQNRHDYFVPVIIVIVLGITVVATFFDSRIDRHTVHARAVEQNHTNIVGAMDESSAAGPESNTIITQNNTAVTEYTAATAGLVGSATIKPPPSVKTSSQAAAVHHSRVPHTGRTAYYDHSGPPPVSSGMSALRLEYYKVMIAARRRAYDDSLQMHRDRPYKLNDYRAAIPWRIEHPRW